MTPNKIRIHLDSVEIDADTLLVDMLNELNLVLAEIPEEFKKETKVDFSFSDFVGRYIEVHFHYERWETPEEVEAKVAKEKAEEAAKVARERATLAALTQKYGAPR